VLACLQGRARPAEEGAGHRSFLIASIVRPEVMIPIVGEGVTEAIGPKLFFQFPAVLKTIETEGASQGAHLTSRV
jgi:hypothetical protein